MQLLHSDLELVVKSGFIYVPLLFDPDIAREVQERSHGEGRLAGQPSGESSPVVEVEGRRFVKSVRIQSILANYERIDKEYYEQLKKGYLQESEGLPVLEAMSPDSKLLTIILKIMPYFIRKRKGFKRQRLSDEELLDLVRNKIDIPESIMEQAGRYFDSGPLLRTLNDLNRMEQTIGPLEEGPITSEALRRWFVKALEAQIVTREKARIEHELRERERLGESRRNHIATLLYLAQKGSFELDGFGFSRMGSSNDYFVYKRTGEYILKDYYDRSYLFPDCRVAVPTTRPFRPLVLETYKHPFLLGHAPKQEICLGGEYDWPDEFTAENIIRLLEDGINALLYSYDARRRNGYHSLDPTLYYVKTIEFEDYRM